jgi:N-acetylmuramic acid 6-phosphate etherase
VKIAITPLVGPEVIAGSTRMKAGTATKLVLNMLSTAVMIRLGYVYGNLMVNVEPKNSKLADRAKRIIAESAGVNYEDAGKLLGQSAGNVKVAIVMSRLAIDREAAEARLRAAGGRITEALRAMKE